MHETHAPGTPEPTTPTHTAAAALSPAVTPPATPAAAFRRGLSLRARLAIASAILLAIAAWAVWSYQTDGLLRVLLASPAAGGSRLDAVRTYVLAWGMWAPVVYVAAVMVEVLIAPIPGTLLYAPGGAIFGGFIGGTLSLTGNVLGASIACWLGQTFGKRWRERHSESPQLAQVEARLRRRGAWVIFLLRLNPLTSSDLVSYAAGLADFPVRHVALGTFLGMLPQCFLQAYLAQTLFEAFFSRGWVLVFGGLLAATVTFFLWRSFRPRRQSASSEAL